MKRQATVAAAILVTMLLAGAAQAQITGQYVRDPQEERVPVRPSTWELRDYSEHWMLRCRFEGAASGCADIDAAIMGVWDDLCLPHDRPIPGRFLNRSLFAIEFDPLGEGFTIATDGVVG